MIAFTVRFCIAELRYWNLIDLNLDFQVQEKKDNINGIMQRLLSSVPSRQRVDVSYLLDGPHRKRQAKKPQLAY